MNEQVGLKKLANSPTGSLKFSSTSHALVINFLISGLLSAGILIASDFILATSYFSVLHYQGVRPVISSYRMIPTAKMSDLGEYLLVLRLYRGMYRGVPTLILS